MTMAKEVSKPKVKKGAVINRKRNRTISQDVARCDPKWEDMGGGVLKLKGGNAYIKRGTGNKWASVCKPPTQEQVAA